MDKSLAAWKNASGKKPLVLFGARQTDKTTSVLDFAKREYQHLVFVDFYRQPEMKAAFTASREPQAIIMALGALLRIDITPESTLLFFDEIQDCDDAITALKYFCTDAPEYDVIAAGSLLGVHVAAEGSFPVGYVNMLTMHPMDFEEFLLGTRRGAPIRPCAPLLSHKFTLPGPRPTNAALSNLSSRWRHA